MPVTNKLKIPYPSERQESWYDSFVTMLENIDTKLFGNQEDRNLVLTGGGTIVFNISGPIGILSWSAAIEIVSANTGYIWSVPAGNITINNNHLIYLSLVRSPVSNVSLSMKTGATISNPENDFMIGLFKTDRVYFINGDVIFTGESFDLFSTSTSTVSLSSSAPTQIDAGDSGSGGVSTAGSRADHQHALNTGLVGDLIAVDASAAGAGTSIKIPRADHKHTVLTGTPGSVTFTSAGAGSASTLAKSDHIHGMVSGTPVATGTANAEGSSANPARLDHVHRTAVRGSSSGSLIGTRPQIDFSNQAFIVTDDAGNDWVNVKSTLDIGLFLADKPDASDHVLVLPINKTIVFPASMTGSRATSETASTGTAVFSIQKNTTEFATITFTTSAIGVFSAASQTTFSNTDKLRIVAPNPQDATLADIGINLAGTK